MASTSGPPPRRPPPSPTSGPSFPTDVAADVVATGAQSFVPVEARQDGTGRGFERYPLRGVDDAFLDRSTYEFAAMARGYDTPREVWDAAGRHDPAWPSSTPSSPRAATKWGFAMPPDFQLSGFYVEDGEFDPVPVVVRDPLTGTDARAHRHRRARATTRPMAMAGITVSQARRSHPSASGRCPRSTTSPSATAPIPPRSPAPSKPPCSPAASRPRPTPSILDDAVGASMLFIRLVQGFMALGLVVGVAALGVISARAVVERRQQLGMLRAIGFQPEMIRRTLLAETSIVAFTAIAAGTVLGLVLSYNVIADAGNQLGSTSRSRCPG